ncbi:transcription-repair coupling factor [Peptoniphilus sp. KCTC 25270]|uniref:transcription-repair coupling factor n=1 Tax=Peptoniphilus sp. KCTC 25270 TaxID=2897414 RepID=UPI001E563C17|nr:transcription-repair coupling factor [Peptoniphilus sp. KCTC 25270]MCD1146816.1 transcription-repair coupling factor [Peptoniphilus sp. KCTC 25270]
MHTQQYLEILRESKNFEELNMALESEQTPISIYGMAAQGIGFLGSSLIQERKQPLLVITYDPVKARKLYEDFTYYFEEGVYHLPARELFFFNRDARSNELLKRRLETIHGILDGKAKVVVTTLEAMAGIYLSPENIRNQMMDLSIGDEINLEQMIENLIALGYERVEIVEGMGQFSLRGGILDVFGPTKNPLRIELFDIEVDSIRTFDVATQRSLETLNSCRIYPVQDILLSKEMKEEMGKILKKEVKATEKHGEIAFKRAQEKYLSIIETLENDGYVSNTDLLLPYIPEEKRALLSSYFSKEPILVFDEPKRMDENSERQALDLSDTLSDLVEAGELLKSHLTIQLNYLDVKDQLKKYPILIFNSILKSYKDFPPKKIINYTMRSVTSFNGRIREFQEEIRRYISKEYKVVLLGGSAEKTEKLIDALKSMEFSVERLESAPEIQPGILYVGPGSTHGGFELEEISFVLLNYSEIYGETKKKRKKKTKQNVIDLDHLNYGDYVVHESHGIGQFLGTTQLEVQGTRRDYLSISYRGGDKLFLPMDQLSIIHKYTGSKEVAPKINRLNSSTWKKTKAKAKKSVEEMADDLIKLYAKRESEQGHAFLEDTPWQKEFEASFPFDETDGQLDSIEEIKKDMERSRPMDRLLCADVGYGKTEVALRAAFKAIMDGKQVAILVPTTILAQQHYNTIMERFSDFPVRVGLLSRFRTPAQQKADIEGLRRGSIDLVIGTHRILSKDIKFKDLGLLIIDEEQRFGVRHKEALKLLRSEIDTLTLTATPIPRTLQMSMVGIRDMSVIDEPPEERFPVQTYVVEYNSVMVREAILKEIERGGQVYFVYNRVQSMEMMLAELRKLVPEASFAMANGQMSERELEDTMIQFVEKEIDVLLCSTIIETGMDVSNANTMIIWESNRLGLSQLYQLRGRIGRSNRIAYAYFTYKKDANISEIAEKRLRAIREFTEFGSGYKIALRDLEIRGSGNILGESQHGHMDAIGYDLYVKFLRQAVSKLKGDEVEEKVETTIDLILDAFLPKAYIRDDSQRMDMYRKIAIIENDFDEEDVIDELVDRFGDPPRAVINLIQMSKVRNRAAKVAIESISQKKDKITVTFIPEKEMELSLINEMTIAFGKKVVFTPGEKMEFTLKIDKDPMKELETFVDVVEKNRPKM